MANKQINELTEITSVEAADLLVVYDDSEGGTEKTKSIAVENIINNSENVIINGDFNIWQRGVTFTSITNGAFGPDRFKYVNVGTSVHDLTRDTDIPTLAQSGHQSNYSVKLDCTTIDASIAAADIVGFHYKMEGYDFAPLQGQTITVSFWVKATKIGTYCFSMKNASNDASYVAEYSVLVTNTWEKKTITIPLTAAATGTWDYTTGAGLQITWVLAAGTNFHGTADTWVNSNILATSNQVNACDNTANDFFLSQVKLELGNVTAFNCKQIQDEIADCQRYFQKTYDIDVDPGAATIVGAINLSSSNHTNADYTLVDTYSFKVEMRDNPTMTSYDEAGNSTKVTMAAGDNIAATWSRIGTSSARIVGTNGAASTARALSYHATADAEL